MNILLVLIVHLAIGSAIAYFIKPFSALIDGLIGAAAGMLFCFIFNTQLPQPELTNLLINAGIASFYSALFAFLAGVRHEKDRLRKREANRANSETETNFRQ